MVRKLWAGALAGVLACTAPGWGQAPRTATAPPAKPEAAAPPAKPEAAERIITVSEPGKPSQKCRVLRCWTQKDGSRVCEVQDVKTGEKMTILQEPAGTKKALAKIFRWGKSGGAPAGAPTR